MQVYSKSKLANIYFTTELARRLEGTGVTVNCLHPGTVATGYGRDGDSSGVLAFGLKVIKPFILTAAQGARTSIYLASSPDVAGVTGQYFVKCKARKPSAAAQDDEAARRLWKISEELVAARENPDAASGPTGLSPPRPCRRPAGGRRRRPAIPTRTRRPLTMTPAWSAMASAVWANCSTSRIVMPSCGDGLGHELVELGHDERGEAHGDLVEQQQARVGEQRPGQGQHLLLASREPPRQLPTALPEDREPGVALLLEVGDLRGPASGSCT